MRLALKLVIHLLVLRHLMKQDIELQEDCQPVSRLRLIRQAIINHFTKQLVPAQQHLPQLLAVAGVNDDLKFGNRFRVILNDVIE